MRALFGFDPDAAGARTDVARNFEQGLGFWSRDYFLQVLRGPRTPFAQMQEARRGLDAVIFEEITRRRRTGERGKDVLSLLIDASDEDGNRLTDRQIRDEVMTLLFAGHDTTTSTSRSCSTSSPASPTSSRRCATSRTACSAASGPTRRC